MILTVFANCSKMTQEINEPQGSWRDFILPGSLALLWLIVLGPIFIRMPVTNDAVLYDLESRWISEGLIPYRDYVEVNFPGVLVIHYATRTVFGESDEALKFADLLLLSGTLLFALLIVRLITKSMIPAIWALSLALLFYLSQSEWCHCQRDTWLLLPTMVGCFLRIRQVHKILEQEPHTTFSFSLLEGIVWGCGIWLKPHLLVMCVTVWAFSLLMTEGWNRKSVDAFGLLAGGLIVGGIGMWGLHKIDAFDSLFVSLTEWSPGYLAARFDNWTLPRYVGMVYHFAPWHLLHLVALPISMRAIFLFLFKQRDDISFARVSLSAVYLVWFLQSHLLQHLFDYVHVPALLLSIFVLAAHSGEIKFLRSPALMIAFIAVALLTSPMANLQTMKLWPTAIQRDLTPAQTDHVAQLMNPKWEDLNKVEEFLRSQNVQNEDVLMYNSDLVTLYWDLNLKSPTPYIYYYEIQAYLPERKELLLASLEKGNQKFVVTDLVGCGMPIPFAEEVDEQGELAPPPRYRRANLKSYPWSEPVVFRSGRYLVHQERAAE